MKKLFYASNLLTLCLVCSSYSGQAQTPVITSGPSNSTVCAGTSATFSAVINPADTIPTHFMWEHSADGTTWDTLTNGGLYMGATSDTLTVAGDTSLNGDMFRVYAINDSGTSLVSSSAIFTVNPLPYAGAITGANAVCLGSNITLSAAGTGTWSSSNIAVATVGSTTGAVHGVAGGIDTVSYTVTNGCGSSTATHTVSVDLSNTALPVTGPYTVCVGSAIHFINAASGGVWTVTNGNATISDMGYATGVAGGMDTAVYTYTNACGSVSSSQSFTVETVLSAGTISGPATVCNGSLISLTESEPGGYWISGDASIATTDASGHVTGRSQGTVSISYLFVNSCGSSVTVDTITVENPATAITGMDSVGVGMMTTLTDSATGGFWTSSNSAIAAVDSATGMVMGMSVGTATISYTVTNTCGTNTVVITMNVGTAPLAGTISGGDTVCMGSTLALMPSVAGGVWSVVNANASVSDTGLVTGIVGGTMDTVIYTVSNAFGTNSVSYPVYVNQAPAITITGPTSIVVGSAYTVTATPAGGTWVSLVPARAQFINPAAGVFVVTAGGNEDLVYYATNSCGTSTDTFHISLPGGTNAVTNVNGTASELTVYPNPATGNITLNLASAISEQAHVTVVNMAGQTVKEFDVTTNKANSVVLDVPSGVYFLNAATSTNKFETKITIAK